jgi:hypothetical protein
MSQMIVSILETSKRPPRPEEADALKWVLDADLITAPEQQPGPLPPQNTEEALLQTPRTAEQIILGLERLVDDIWALGNSEDLDAAMERCTEAGMWVERYLKRTAK